MLQTLQVFINGRKYVVEKGRINICQKIFDFLKILISNHESKDQRNIFWFTVFRWAELCDSGNSNSGTELSPVLPLPTPLPDIKATSWALQARMECVLREARYTTKWNLLFFRENYHFWFFTSSVRSGLVKKYHLDSGDN